MAGAPCYCIAAGHVAILSGTRPNGVHNSFDLGPLLSAYIQSLASRQAQYGDHGCDVHRSLPPPVIAILITIWIGTALDALPSTFLSFCSLYPSSPGHHPAHRHQRSRIDPSLGARTCSIQGWDHQGVPSSYLPGESTPSETR